MDQYEEREAYFATEDEQWQEDELYAWYAGAENSWDMSWESAEASWYPAIAWYGDDSSWKDHVKTNMRRWLRTASTRQKTQNR